MFIGCGGVGNFVVYVIFDDDFVFGVECGCELLLYLNVNEYVCLCVVGCRG